MVIENTDRYEYDVFLSYSRKPIFYKWTKEIFLPLFKHYLSQELNIREPRIFIDEKEINGGDEWATRIKDALAKSKCMVALFSPAYFQSEWCVKEFNLMNHRQIKLGFLSKKKPQGLIIPASICDGIHFDDYVNRIQRVNFNDYCRDGITKGTDKYLKFEDMLIEWIPEVAQAVRAAPKWKTSWLGDKWLNESQQYIKVVIPTMTQPLL